MAATEVGATTVSGEEGGLAGEENVGRNYPALLTLRVIMHGREAGSIIGKRGENVKKFREETGARINISDATSPERIVTVTGSLDQIVATFRMVCCRFEEDLQQLNAALGGSEMSKHLVGLRLILPAIQCGSVIGRSGAKVKEIRDNSGASVQISGDLLPNSTERLVTVSGSVDAVIKAVEMICGVILECPIKGPVSQYRPKPTRPVNLILPMQYEPPSHHTGQFQLPAMSYPQVFNSLSYPTLIASQQTIVALPYSALPPGTLLQPLSTSCNFPQINGAQTLTSAVGQSAQPTQILTIPNELIGCIIGRGGAKINEIRQQSGANIKISSSDDRSSERVIAITGTQDSVISAIQLIEHSLEAHKATMFGSNIRHSRSNSSIGLCQQAKQQSAFDNSKSNETVEMAVTSSQSDSAKISHLLQRSHNVVGGDLSQCPPTSSSFSSSLFQPTQGFPFHQSPTFQQNLNTAPSFLLPLSHVQPLVQPLLAPKCLRGQATESTALVEGSQTDQYQAGQPTFQGGTLITAGSHSGQHIFNPNLYHVQTSSAIQIAFRPLNLTGSMMESQLLEASNGSLMILETPTGATTTSPDGSNCLIDPTRMLGLKSKNNNGCGGYVLTTGSRSGFKFAPY